MSKLITYVYLSGRKQRLTEEFSDAEEFFYSYLHFKRLGLNTEVIEFSHNQGILNSIMKFIDKILRKVTKLPIFMSDILILKNIKKFFDSDHVILTSDRIACSIIPVLFINSFRKRKTNFSCVVLGLFQHKNITGLRKILQNILLLIILNSCKNFIFLGKGEFEYAKKTHPKYNNKFNFIPFCVDTNFWRIEKNNVDKKGVLFVGNDGNRLYDLILELAGKLPDIEFNIITSNIKESQIRSENINLIKGHWQSNLITDTELKKFYQQSKLTLIPLKNTLQPSGQSVALQSMANGTPVLISKTDGFWNYDDFLHGENIFFVEENDLEVWKESIEKLYFNSNKLESLSENGLKTINENYNLEIFNKSLENLLEI